MSVGIIGAGRIGSRLFERLKRYSGVDVDFVCKDDGVYSDLETRVDDLENWNRHLDDQDVVFLAIPTLDDGTIAFQYIQECLKRGIKVVTCEKGALSGYYHELRGALGKNVGYTATVGGGTEMLPFLKRRMWDRLRWGDALKGVHVVLNGTLNYIFDEASKGRNLDEVAEEVKQKGFAEPNDNGILGIIDGEIKDTVMKTSILCNDCDMGYVTPRMIKVVNTDIDIDKLLREAGNRRYIVSITTKGGEKDVIAGFRHFIPQPGAHNLSVCAGFKRLDSNPLYERLALPGVNNAVLVDEGENGVYMLSGPGAGADPTVTTMLADAKRLVW